MKRCGPGALGSSRAAFQIGQSEDGFPIKGEHSPQHQVRPIVFRLEVESRLQLSFRILRPTGERMLSASSVSRGRSEQWSAGGRCECWGLGRMFVRRIAVRRRKGQWSGVNDQGQLNL